MRVFFHLWISFFILNQCSSTTLDVKSIDQLEVGDHFNFSSEFSFGTPVLESFIYTFGCVKIDLKSNKFDYDVDFYNDVKYIGYSKPLFFNVFLKIGNMFKTKPAKKDSVVKSFCISPYQQKFVVVKPSFADSQEISVNISMINFNANSLILLATGIVLFYQSTKLSQSLCFLYATTSIISIAGAFLLVLFLIMKFVPSKKHVTIISVLFGAGSLITFVYHKLREYLLELTMKYYYISISYVVISGLVGLAVAYRYSSSLHKKTYHIIDWLLKIISVAIIFCSCQSSKVALSIVTMMFTYKLLMSVKKSLANTAKVPGQLISFLKRAPFIFRKLKEENVLLTKEEYEKQGREETERALKHLRQQMLSSEISPWKTVSVLKEPKEFSSFVEGGDHVSPEERTLYENEISFYDDSSDCSDDLIVANKENLVLSENSKFLNQIPKERKHSDVLRRGSSKIKVTSQYLTDDDDDDVMASDDQ